jgi:hypothetical protein
MKRNIIDILIEQAIPKGDAVQPKFNPDPRAVLPGKYVGMRGYEFAWNEVTKSYWIKPRKAAAFEWRNMFYEPEYKLLSVRLRAAYDEYEKDLTDAIAKAEKKLNAKETSEEETTEEKKKWHLFKRAKEKIEKETSKIANKLSGNTIYKTDMHYFYKLENGVYSYQNADNAIDPAKWKADDKVLTPEITSYINGLPERTETEMVTMYNGLNKIKDAAGAEIKPLADPSDPNKKAGTNYIKLDGIYYSIPFTSNRGLLKTTPLASIIYEPGGGLSAYNEKIAAIDALQVGQYVYNKSTGTTTEPQNDVVNNNPEFITQGAWEYKKEKGKYYTRQTGKTKWIDIDTSKLSKKNKQTTKDAIDKMYAKVPAKEKETSTEVGGTKNQALTKITKNITNTYKIGQRYIELVSGKYDAMLEELKAETNEEKQTEIRNKYKDMISTGFDSNILPPLVTSVNEVNGLDQTDAVIQRHSKYVTLNKLSIEMQNEAWKLYILGEAKTAADKTKESIIYNIDKSSTGEDIVVQEPYGVDFNN